MADRRLAGLADELRSGWGTLLKPLAWQGELCYGPSAGQPGHLHATRRTRARRGPASPTPSRPRRQAIVAYLGAYGPATSDAFSGWLSGGWFGKRVLRGLVRVAGDDLVEVDVEGERAYLPAGDLDGLLATRRRGPSGWCRASTSRSWGPGQPTAT